MGREPTPTPKYLHVTAIDRTDQPVDRADQNAYRATCQFGRHDRPHTPDCVTFSFAAPFDVQGPELELVAEECLLAWLDERRAWMAQYTMVGREFEADHPRWARALDDLIAAIFRRRRG